MARDYEPLLQPTKISALRPTQMTVGMREVARKRESWRERCAKDGPEFLGHHMIPVVLGPKGHPWLVDHHHLALALHEEGEQHVLISVVADLSHLKLSEFLTVLDNRSWIHPFDADGERHGYHKLPKSVTGLDDDPYRSLAGELRRVGAYAKSDTPFSEFLWADFLRRRIRSKLVQTRFEKAIDRAVKLARSKDASHLPGWAGPGG